MNLTELGVRRLKPDPSKHTEIHDDVARGLVLWVGKGGGKSWFFVKAGNGARHRFKIGSYPALSLGEARGKANALAGQLAAGTLPRKRAASAERGAVRIVDELIAAFVDDYKRDHKSWRDVELDLRKHVSPVIGRLRVERVRRNDIGDVLLELLAHPRVHNKVKVHLSGLFKWAGRRGLVEASPVVGFESLPTKARDRVLAGAELKAIWKACDAVGYPYGPYVQLLMLLGQRRTETAAMERAKVGHSSGIWEIPGTVTKNGRTHLVPLPSLALEIIRSVPAVVDADGNSSPWVFPSKSKLSRHITTYSDAKEALDKASGVTGWWLHDLRRTVSTGMAGLGVQPVVIEAALNHASGTRAGVAGTYNRHEYLEEKRAALEAWSIFLSGVLRD
jgi:integrase